MALNGSVHGNGQRITFLSAHALAAAETAVVTAPVKFLTGMKIVVAEASFVRAAGGTNAKFWIQTSLDAGATWIDIINFAFVTTTANLVAVCNAYLATSAASLTPTDGTLADNTVVPGVLGSYLRLKYTTTGTYSGASSITINAVVKG